MSKYIQNNLSGFLTMSALELREIRAAKATVVEDANKRWESSGNGHEFFISGRRYFLWHLGWDLYVQGPMPRENSVYALSKPKVAVKGSILRTSPEDVVDRVGRVLADASGHKLDEYGYVYLVSDGTHTKIGATTKPVGKRLIELQVGNVCELSVVGSYPVSNKFSTEAYLHEKFADKRVRGEWFRLTEQDTYTILSEAVDIANRGRFFGFSPSERSGLRDTIREVYQSARWGYEQAVRRLIPHMAPGERESVLTSRLSRFGPDIVDFMRKAA